MKWFSTILLTRLLLSGGFCDALWDARVAALLRSEGIVSAPLARASGLDLRSEVAPGGVTTRLIGALHHRLGRVGVTVQGLVEIDRIGSAGEHGRISPAGCLDLGRWQIGFGSGRGGLGAGLLCDFRWRMQPGARVRRAWNGLPGGLRPAALSPADPRPRVLTLAGGRGGKTVFALVDEAGRAPRLLAGFEPGSTTRAVVLLAGDSRAVELSCGRAGDEFAWRLSGGIWNGGGSGELLFSRCRDRIAWDVACWGWTGSRPPLAPPVGMASGDRRGGIRACLELHPADPLRLAWYSESAFGPGARFGGYRWWRSHSRVSIRPDRGPEWNLSYRNTRTREDLLWRQPGRTASRVTDLQVKGKPGGTWRWRFGFRRSEDEQGSGSGGASTGSWFQLEWAGKGWNGYLRGSYALPENGPGIWWYEPAPFPGRNLRRAAARGAALILGVNGSGGRFRTRLLIDETGTGTFLVRFRLHR